MPQVNAGELLDDRQGNKNGTTPTLQPWPSPLRLLPVPTRETQPHGNQIPINRAAEKESGNYLKALLNKDFEKVFQNWE